MANFKHYFDSRFAGCRLIAKAYDQHRNRDVSIYLLPGMVDVVGVSDGVDRWVAPVAPELFSVNIQQVLRDIHSGVPITLPVVAGKPQAARTGRRALILEDGASPPQAEEKPILRRPSKALAPSRTRRTII